MTRPADQHSAVHSTFRIERVYPAAPARVFAAFADQQTKRRWFAEGEGWDVEQFAVDFRVGGQETARFRFTGGPPMGSDTIYLDIVPQQRLVFAYTMLADGKRMSVSLATIEIEPAGSGTRLIYTEQGVFLDGADLSAGREIGCAELLDKLGEELATYA